MSHGRDGIGVIFFGDKLFSVGGYDGHHYENIVEVYDPQTNEWSQVMKKIYIINTKLFGVLSTYYVLTYLPRNCIVSFQAAPLNTARAGTCLVVLKN